MSHCKFRDKSYYVELCTLHDIRNHYMLIKHLVSDIAESVYIDRMVKSINTGSAFKLKGTNTFIYYIKDNINKSGEGVSIYGSNPLDTLVMLKIIFTKGLDNSTKLIRMSPHFSKNKSKRSLYFNSLVYRPSIRMWHCKENPLVINVTNLIDKLTPLLGK